MTAPVQTKAEVLTRLKAACAPMRALGVARLALFGSFVRDAATPTSDVDLLVTFEPGALTGLRSYFAVVDLLETTLGRRVELLSPTGLSPFIGPHILQEAQDVPLTA